MNHSLVGMVYSMTSLMAGFTAYQYIMWVRIATTTGMSLNFNHMSYESHMTFHGITMMFGFVMPMMSGAVSNWIVPQIVGLPDMMMCRMNVLSVQLYMVGGRGLYASS